VNIANSRIKARLLYVLTADVQDTETTVTVTASLLLSPAASVVSPIILQYVVELLING
jgi:hypothetical protein